MLEIKDNVTELKSAFDASVDWIWTWKKKSMSLNIGQQKLHKVKCKRKLIIMMKHSIQKLWKFFTLCIIHAIEMPREETENRAEKIF